MSESSNVVGIYRTIADRDRLYAAIVQIEGGQHGLTPDELQGVQALVWRAWCEWGDRAGLIPVTVHLPDGLAPDVHAQCVAASKAATLEALNVYRAMVLAERIECEARRALDERNRRD